MGSSGTSGVQKMSDLTVTITACDRTDLLFRTMQSFFKYNSYPIEQFIIRDDSGLAVVHKETNELMKFFKVPYLLLEKGQMGQARSIDRMLDKVNTEYVFHLEDDWEFYRPDFIDDSFSVIDDETSQVWVRSWEDGVVAKVGEEREMCGLKYNYMEKFSFNPHLRKMSDLRFTGKNETILGEEMVKSGKKTKWLQKGYCKHLGWVKTTNRPGTPYHAGVVKA